MKKRCTDIDSIFLLIWSTLIIAYAFWAMREPSRVANQLDKMGFHDPYEVIVYKGGDGKFRFDKEGVFYECDFDNYNDKLIVTNCAKAPEFKLDEIEAPK